MDEIKIPLPDVLVHALEDQKPDDWTLPQYIAYLTDMHYRVLQKMGMSRFKPITAPKKKKGKDND